MMYFNLEACLGKQEENYYGIGHVTVLSGQAIYLPFESKIASCYVRPGQYVKKNQSLFLLDKLMLEKEMYKLEVEQLELKQSLYDLDKNKIHQSEGALNLSQAFQEMEYAKKRFDDSQKLLDAGIVSEEEYLWDKRRHQQAIDNYKKHQTMAKHLNNHRISQEKRTLLIKKIKNTQLQLNQIKKYWHNPVLVSKQSGIVLPVKLKTNEYYCQPGEKLSADQAIFWLAPIENRRVELKLDQAELDYVKVGSKSEITYLGQGAHSFLSEVLEIEAIPEPNSSPPKYKVYLKAQKETNIRLGTQARVKVYFE